MSELKLATTVNDSLAPYIQGDKKSMIYVENDNNCSQKEPTMANNDITTDLTSLQYGSTSTIRVQRAFQVLDQLVIAFRLNTTSVPLSDYIAYSLIDNIRYSVSSTEPIVLQGPQLLHMALEQCDSIEKKEALLRVSGKRVFGTTGAANHDVQTDVTLANRSDEERTFYAYIPFPWSTISRKNKVKPLPLHLLDQSLEINITIKRKDEVVNAGADSLEMARIYWKYQKFGDIKMSKSPMVEYKYPCITSVHTKYNVAAPTNDEPVSINLNSFRDGEVTDLLFHVAVQGAATTSEAGITGKRFFDGVKLSNIKLQYNGTVIWRADDRINEFWNMLDGDSYEYIHNEREYQIKGTAAANVPVMGFTGNVNNVLLVKGKAIVNGAPVNAQMQKYAGLKEGSFYYNIPISVIKSSLQGNGHFLGANFNKDSLVLSFDPPKSRAAADDLSLENKGFTLFLSTNYRTIYKFQGGRVRLHW